MHLERYVDVRMGIRSEGPNAAIGSAISAIVEINSTAETGPDWGGIFRNYDEVKTWAEENENWLIVKAAKVYFEAGGGGLKLLRMKLTAENSLQDMIRLLERECVNITVLGLSYSDVNTVVNDINSGGANADVKLSDKLFHYDLLSSNVPDQEIATNTRGLSVHLVNSVESFHSVRAMVYLMRCKADGTDSVKPYMFTDLGVTPLSVTSVSLDIYQERNYNTYIEITNGVKGVVPGNTTSGTQLVEHYLTIVTLQRLTRILITYMVRNKPTFATGTSAMVRNILSRALDKLQASEWLVPGTVESPVAVVRDGKEHVLLTVGEFLPEGYKIAILPVTAADKQAQTFSPIYIFLSTATGIKKFMIRGGVV